MLTSALVVSMIATAVLAGVSLTYRTGSATTLAVVSAPIAFVDTGLDDGNRYLSDVTLSTNATRFTATLNGVAEANLTIQKMFKFTNQDSSSHAVTFSIASVVATAGIDTLKLAFYNNADDSLKASWDLEATTSVTVPAMAAGATYYAKVFFELAAGAGTDTIGQTLTISLGSF